MKRYAVLFLVYLCITQTQAQQPVYRHFTTNDGLPSSETYCVVQDAEGYIWVSTDRGVCRFDGYHFKTYTTREGLSDNTVFSVTQDSSGKLWLFGLTGKIDCMYGGRIKRMAFGSRIDKIIAGNGISSVTETGKSELWVGLNIKPMALKISGKDTQFIRYPASQTYIQTAGNSIVFGNTNSEIISDYDTVRVISPQGVFVLPYKPCSVFRGHLFCIKLHDGSLLMAKGSTLVHIKNGKIINVSSIDNEEFISLYEDKAHHIWISYDKLGAVCYEERPGNLVPLMHCLPGKGVSRVYEDREGNFWFSSPRSGLFLLTSKNYLSYTTADGLAGNNITAICGDENVVWAGTDHGEVYGFKDGRIIKTLYLNNLNNTIQSMIYTAGKSLWIGAVARTCLYRGNTLKTVQAGEGGMRAMCPASAGGIWGGRNKLHYFSADGTKVKNFSGFSSYMDALYEDSSGCVWIGCSNGLWRYVNGLFEYCGARNPILTTRVKDIKPGKDHSLWVATLGNGVIRLKNGRCIVYDTRNGLLNNLCNKIFVDRQGLVWVCSNQGLSRITLLKGDEIAVKNYTYANGLTSNEVHDVFRQKNKIWVATSAGLNVFDITAYENPPADPPVYFTSLAINGRDTAVLHSYALKYNQNFLSVNYIALSYKNNGKVRYRYKLAGLDSNWVYTNALAAQYSSLRPGRYRFLVNAARYDGTWGKNYASFDVYIANPYWRTAWFWVCILCGILLASGGVIYSQVWQMNQKRKLLDQLNQYKQQALSAQMNPHFIFNSLNSIQKYILENDKAASNKYLTKFASLMRLTLDNSQYIDISLEEDLHALKLYIDLEKMRFKEKLEYNISIGPGIDTRRIRVPVLLIQPFVENAIKHGITPKETAGHLHIDIKRYENQVIIAVADDGVGRAAHAALMQKEKESNGAVINGHRSAGMEITRKRAELMSALYKKEIKIEVTDLDNPAGTLVILKIPLY